MNGPKDDLTAEERELLRDHAALLQAARARHADCPPLEVLLASQAGVLPEETERKVAAHLEKCGFCQILLKDLASEELTSATGEEARRVRERVLASAKPQTKNAKAGGGFLSIWLWRAIPVTALAGAAIAMLLWVRLHPSVTPVSPTVATVKPAAKPTLPSPPQWEKLPIRLQAESVLVWRGKPRNAQERYASELTSALAFYRDDKFADAVERLSKVAKDFPRGIEGQLYLGIAELKLDRNAEAIAPLRAAKQLGPEPYRDDAGWYLALALWRDGDLASAEGELQGLCKGKSDYAARACSDVKELSDELERKP